MAEKKYNINIDNRDLEDQEVSGWLVALSALQTNAVFIDINLPERENVHAQWGNFNQF